MEDVTTKMQAVLAGNAPNLADAITVHVVIAGLSMVGGDPAYAGIDDDTLRQHLLDAGRRLLGRPRRQRPSKSRLESVPPQSPRA